MIWILDILVKICLVDWAKNRSVSQKFGYLDLISFEILDLIFYLVQLLELEMEEI